MVKTGWFLYKFFLCRHTMINCCSTVIDSLLASFKTNICLTTKQVLSVMTSREDEILQLIKDDPFIQQQSIADKLNISRSAVAVHIMNMTRKGVIRGKGYIVDRPQYVVVIGGTNMDILGQPEVAMVERDSNPGKITGSAGGVGRNIAENLARLGVDTKLISVVGDDAYGNVVLEATRKAGVDVKAVSQLTGQTTSTYLSLLDAHGDMLAAVSDMSILDHLNIGLLAQHTDLIQHAAAIIIDTNLNDDVLAYLFSKFHDQVIYLDTVSTAKSIKAKPYLKHIHTLKPNLLEAETISGLPLNSDEDIDDIADWFIQQGITRLFLSLGADGILYRSAEDTALIRPSKVNVVNANGAGDAFLAGLVYGQMNNLTDAESCRFALGCAMLTMEHMQTINPTITELMVLQRLEEALC